MAAIFAQWERIDDLLLRVHKVLKTLIGVVGCLYILPYEPGETVNKKWPYITQPFTCYYYYS